MGALEKRVAALEATTPAEPVTVILGSLDRDDVTRIRTAFGHGDRTWHRRVGETAADFRARVAEAGEREGYRVLVEVGHG
jgi:hypothetical protein